jgi:hypothetical protein
MPFGGTGTRSPRGFPWRRRFLSLPPENVPKNVQMYDPILFSIANKRDPIAKPDMSYDTRQADKG